MRASSIDIHPNAKWSQNGITVAGGNGLRSETNQLNYPLDLYVDDDQTIYVADYSNHRIVEWKSGATNGNVVAGGNGAHQLNLPQDVIIDKESDSLIISDSGNRRVVRWPRRNGTHGETIISNIACYGLTMDDNSCLYVVDWRQDEVRRYKIGDTKGTVVAGGNGPGNRLDQLSHPRYVFVDRDHSVYVSDWENNRVMKWEEGVKQGIVVAGGQGEGNSLTQLTSPYGVVVDQLGTVYVADFGNHRIMRWPKGVTQGSVIIGGNGQGAQSNQLNCPIGLSFDRHEIFSVTVGSVWQKCQPIPPLAPTTSYQQQQCNHGSDDPNDPSELRRSSRIINKIAATTTTASKNDINNDKKIDKSSIFQHEKDTGHRMDCSNFQVVWQDNHYYRLLFKESLLIKAYEPELNKTTHSVPLLAFPDDLPKVQLPNLDH
ncbi:unnamed protein product [Rotaria sp. Silwood1]|nr:unnamed protein product [Rotaria sp. Silwood1]CAF1165019.1 unnamed protein product [Rotaria sp. Silwood1]